MEDRLTMSRYFEDANVEFMTGAYTQCWQSWRYDNVTPAYNKLYYVVDGEFYLKINDAEYQAQAGQMFLLPYNSTQTYYHFSSHLATKYWVHFTAPCKVGICLSSFPCLISSTWRIRKSSPIGSPKCWS